MAITNVTGTSGGAGVTAAVTLASATEITLTAPGIILADNLPVGKNAIVYRRGPSGSFLPATNKEGAIVLSAFPNMVVVEGPAVYKVTKDATSVEVHIGYEEC